MIERVNKVLQRRVQAIRFFIAGVVVACVGLVVLYILTDFFHVWYLLASTFAFFVTLIVNFFIQKYWTFKDTSKRIKLQLSLFFINSIFNLALNTILMYGMVDVVKINHLLSQAIVMVILATVNYTVYRVYIFRPVFVVQNNHVQNESL